MKLFDYKKKTLFAKGRWEHSHSIRADWAYKRVSMTKFEKSALVHSIRKQHT